MKKIMISVKPKWVDLILRGDKTLEIRKVKPKAEPPFELYIYCSQGRNELLTGVVYENYYAKEVPLNGTVVAKCIVDKIDHFTTFNGYTEELEEIVKKSCVDIRDLNDYEEQTLHCKGMYALHLKNVEAIFVRGLKKLEDYGIKHAPQNYCYIEEKNETK